jgi:WD40 repeat protein
MLGKFIYISQEDGSIKILKVKKTKIELVRSLPKAESRCLSLALEGAQDESQAVKSLFAGYADSSIRRWDLFTGSSVLHFEKLSQKKKKRGKEECQVWQLRLCSGEHLVSGDSQGDVCMWDARTGALVKRFSQLKGDVLALEVCAATRAVYASGADSRVVSFQLEADSGEWVFASACRG